jgi:hypothetical protein
MALATIYAPVLGHRSPHLISLQNLDLLELQLKLG